MKQIYLDYAAATPLLPEVMAAMQPYFSERFFNPSANYLAAQAVRQDIEAARRKVAEILGVKAPEIIFTAGGTEANNLAIQGVMRRYPEANSIVSAIEHDSVLKPAAAYGRKLLPVDEAGTVKIAELKWLIDEQTVLISVMYANNEIGTIQPLGEISRLIKEIRDQRLKTGNRLPLLLHTDACQAANYLNLKLKGEADLMTINGGKIYGPKQTGLLYIRSGISLLPQNLGGGQEHGLRSGTENVPGIIGLAAALEIAQRDRVAESKRLKKIQENTITKLLAAVPGVIVNGSFQRLSAKADPKQVRRAALAGHRLPNNLHISLPGQDNERLMMALDEAGIQVAAGSACSASSQEPSHVLQAIGLSDQLARASLRITMGRMTTEDDMDIFINHLSAQNAPR